MSRAVEKSPLFHADVMSQFGWYFEKAGEQLAWQFFEAVDFTILKLAGHPDLGSVRHFHDPMLHGLRSLSIEAPFHKFLIFYRVTETTVMAWRLMHGSRDLPRRLTEPPGR